MLNVLLEVLTKETYENDRNIRGLYRQIENFEDNKKINENA